MSEPSRRFGASVHFGSLPLGTLTNSQKTLLFEPLDVTRLCWAGVLTRAPNRESNWMASNR
jgi:hypothetical protein